jgi:maleylpyruvate isomerase
MTTSSPMKLTLFGYWRSSSAWRVRTTLALKGIAYEYVPVHLVKDGGEQWKPEYLARNPQGMVPLLEIEEHGERRRLGQSVAIIEYLDERVPEPALLPRDPWLRGRTRQLVEVVNSSIQPLQNSVLLKHLANEVKTDEKAFARHFMGRGLAALDKLVAETAGTFSVGDSVTTADIYLVPQLYNARRFELDVAPFQRLLAIEAACAALPAFQAAHPDRQPDAQSAS